MQYQRYAQSQLTYDDALRFQELDNSEDELLSGTTYNHGVPASVYEVKHNTRSFSDELYFNDGGSRYPRQSNSDEHLAYGERYESRSEESEEGEEDSGRRRRRSASGVTHQLVRQSSDQLMAQRALDRIDRAKAKGKTSVNLTHDEIEALEKRFARSSDSPERARRSSSGNKDKSGKGGQSPSGTSGAWTRKRASSRRSSIVANSTALALPKQRNSRKKHGSPPRGEESIQAPPGFMTTGPGGVPIYAPIGYYNTQGPPSGRRTASETPRYSPPRSGDSSRSTSASSRRGVPPYEGPPYPSARSRGPPSPATDENYAGFPSHPHQNQHDGRRTASGPAQVNYSHVYRRVPGQPSGSRTRLTPTSSDPSLYHPERGPSGLGNEYEPSSATSSDDDGDEDEELSRSRDSVYVDERERRRMPAGPAAAAVSSSAPSPSTNQTIRPRRRR